MKAKLIYNLPEEALEHNRAVKSTDLALALWDIDQLHRNLIKYRVEGEGLDYNTVEKVFEDIRDILVNYDINLDTLID